MADQSLPQLSSPPPARHLWQVPVFVLGAIVLASVLLARPLWNNPLVRAEAHLDHARRLWQNRDDHPRKIIELVSSYLDQLGPEAPRAAEAHLIWGSTLARSARTTKLPDSVPLWQEAHAHLIQARDLGLAEPDLFIMRVALGECGYYTDDDLATVCQRLTRNLDYADDRPEACRVLTLAHLKKTPPDLVAALKANERLRQLPLLGEEVLGPARLQGGEILLRLNQPTEARKLLEKISHDAAPEVLTRARILRARSHQDEGQWSDAASLWQQMLTAGSPLTDPGEARWFLGLCHRRLEQLDEAKTVWREGMKAGGAAGSACALGLADILQAANDPAAVDGLLLAVRELRDPAGWTNPYVGLKQVREQFEQACRALCQARAFDKALALAEAYERLAAPGMGAYQRALVLLASGQAQHSADLLRQAGMAFETAADAVKGSAPQAERLWLAAAGHLECGDPARAVIVLERFLALGGHAPERFGEAWYLLGRAQEQRMRSADAEAAYRRCITYRGRFAYRARYQIAEAELARGNTDSAVDMLEQNRKQLGVDPDPEALEKSLYLMGHLLFQRRDYPGVRPLLEQAVRDYPASGQAPRGRLELAETYRQLAVQENQNVVRGGNLTPQTREHYLKQRRMWLEKAVEQYEGLSQVLTVDPKSAATLSQAEQVHVYFSVADCRFNLGEYATALKLYDDLADRYQGRLERLSALGGTARCYAAQRDFDRFRSRLDDIRVALKNVDDQTRREWEQWLSVAGKGN